VGLEPGRDGVWTWPWWGLDPASAEGQKGGSVPPGAAAGAGVLGAGRVGGCWGHGPSGWKELGTPVGLQDRWPVSPLAAWAAGASTSATGSCSISNGDFPYLLLFAGGLEPRRRLTSARCHRPAPTLPGLLLPCQPSLGTDVPSPSAALPACGLLLSGWGHGAEGTPPNQLLNSSSSTLKGGKRRPGVGFASFASPLCPSLVTALCRGGGKHLQPPARSRPRCSLSSGNRGLRFLPREGQGGQRQARLPGNAVRGVLAPGIWSQLFNEPLQGSHSQFNSEIAWPRLPGGGGFLRATLRLWTGCPDGSSALLWRPRGSYPAESPLGPDPAVGLR